ncbi:MAG TPA: hypothetical protein DHW82_01970 [Spirochaetia bacterium]|nr:MAG: hypothetical protein A2Y41_07315 [Spirochaetes bacterium GWB1_36_13]HCL55763.1 hypothetical protein [Spirochaetia bacterium]
MNLSDFESYIEAIVKRFQAPVRAKVIKTYTESGKYYIDCKKINLDGSDGKTIYPKVAIPKLWGGEKAGIFAMPSKNTEVSIGFYEGNIHFPYIINIMGSKHDTAHNEDTLIIALDQAEIRVEKEKVSVKYKDSEITIKDKLTVKSKEGDLKALITKLVEKIIAIKTAGSPANHVLDPSTITEFNTIKDSEIGKVFE